jgi:tripartite-type tricarboxylate transporter receptor subunit TctC
MFERRSLQFGIGSVALAGLLAISAVSAQNYPAKPMRIIVPFGAGGSVDTVARLLGQRVAEAWGQQVVVDARPGAGSLIGTDLVAKAPADGYTLLMANASTASAISVYAKIPYDLFRDFTTVGLVGYTPHITVVHPSLPAQTLQDLIRLARANPGDINYSSSGNGVGSHLAVELFKTMAKVNVTHVPYKGAPAAVSAILGGEVSLMIVNLISALPHVQTGKLRALGLADVKRSSLLPTVPTMTEAGLRGYVFTEWYGVLAPAAMPRDAIGKWNSEINRIVATHDFKEKLSALGAEPSTGTPEQFSGYLKTEADRYSKLVKEAGVTVE